MNMKKLIKLIKSKKTYNLIVEHFENDTMTFDELLGKLLSQNGFVDTYKNIEICKLIYKGYIKGDKI